jgi:RNA polymerase sigma-70 factor (ECF subfamily)
MSDWLGRVVSGEPGFEREVVERFTDRLLAFARRQLPDRLRRRVDPEDVVQSVYKSFFRRLGDGQFAFEESHDVWRLLAAITFRKARNAVKFHTRNRRDVRRDLPLAPADDSAHLPAEPAAPEPTAADLATLYDCLERLLAGLPENYRAIVVRRLEGDSIEEIARHVGRSRRTVLRVLAHLPELAARQLDAAP